MRCDELVKSLELYSTLSLQILHHGVTHVRRSAPINGCFDFLNSLVISGEKKCFVYIEVRNEGLTVAAKDAAVLFAEERWCFCPQHTF